MEKSGPASVYTKHRTIIKNSDYHIYFASDKWINCPSLSNCRAIAKLTFLPALCFLCTFLFFFLNLRQHSDSDSHCREARETSKQESLSGYFPMAMLQLELDSLSICCFWLRTTKENNQSSYVFVINGGSPGKVVTAITIAQVRGICTHFQPCVSITHLGSSLSTPGLKFWVLSVIWGSPTADLGHDDGYGGWVWQRTERICNGGKQLNLLVVIESNSID